MIILPGWLITSPLKPPKKDWGIRLQNDKIAEVAENQALSKKYPEDVCIRVTYTFFVYRFLFMVCY